MTCCIISFTPQHSFEILKVRALVASSPSPFRDSTTSVVVADAPLASSAPHSTPPPFRRHGARNAHARPRFIRRFWFQHPSVDGASSSFVTRQSIVRFNSVRYDDAAMFKCIRCFTNRARRRLATSRGIERANDNRFAHERVSVRARDSMGVEGTVATTAR